MDSRLILVAVAAYLLGSIPFGYILVKLFLKQDIRATGSGNIGATNVARSGKKGLAMATLLLDAGKGALAVYLVYAQFGHLYYPLSPTAENLPDWAIVQISSNLTLGPALPALAALFAILGHMFPIWLTFKGGKGVATAIGALYLVSPEGALTSLAIFIVSFAISRYVSLASVIAAAVFPAAAAYDYPPLRTGAVLAMTTTISALIILKHHANIRRLIAGTEPKFGAKAVATADPIQTENNI
jgi:acyl phosphate:glycerol-3-phosphate acyltransferase